MAIQIHDHHASLYAWGLSSLHDGVVSAELGDHILLNATFWSSRSVCSSCGACGMLGMGELLTAGPRAWVLLPSVLLGFYGLRWKG